MTSTERFVLALFVIGAAAVAMLGFMEWDYRRAKAAASVRIEYVDPLRAQLDDILRRTCILYKKRVEAGTMKAGEPEFADCP